jgi:hypothetical protein
MLIARTTRLLLVLAVLFGACRCSHTTAEGPPVDGAATPADHDAAIAADARTPDAGPADAAETDAAEPPLADAAVTVTPDAAPAIDTADALAVMPADGPPAGTLVAVVVGYGSRRVSSLDGLKWEHFQEVNPMGGDDHDLLRGVGYGDGVFVAIGGHTFTSPDGVTWVDHGLTPGEGNFISNVAWFNGAFIGAGGNGMRIRSVDHGTSWKVVAPYMSGHFRDLAVGNGVGVAVGHLYTGTGVAAITRDGITWMDTIHEGATLNSLAFGNGVFVALGVTGRCSRSTDGVKWTDTTLAGTEGQVVFANNEFIASRGAMVYRSKDGMTWTPTGSSHGVSAGFNGHYIGFGWPAGIDVSDDLVKWTNVFRPGGSGFSRLAQGVVAR